MDRMDDMDRVDDIGRSVTVLHLSDLQFGRFHRFLGLDLDTLLHRLRADLRELEKSHGLVPDLLIVTGDLAEWGKQAEFDDALRFVEELTKTLKIERDRVVLIPGNHDVNRDLCRSYFFECKGRDQEATPPYFRKWDNWTGFFERFYRDLPQLTFTESEPWTFFEAPDLRLVVAGLNSTMAESHQDEDHYGLVGEPQLEWFRERLESYEGWLRIGAVHHNVVRGAVADDENLRDAKDLKRILGPHLHLVLHGHTHEGNLSWLEQYVPVLSTGSAALGKESRPEEVPNQYQVIRIESDRLCRWSRQLAPEQRRWIADPRVSRSGDVGYAEYEIPFEVGRKRQRFDAGMMEERVSESDGPIAHIYPVGAVRGDVTEEALDAFLAVHSRYRQTDLGVRSTLVYLPEPLRMADDEPFW